MTEIEGLHEHIEAARADLLAAIEGAPETAEVLDRLWRVGLTEDWLRRAVSRAAASESEGASIDAFLDRPRPAIAQTVAYMAEWLQQSRRPLLSLLTRLPADSLDRPVEVPQRGVTSVRALIEEVARRDREAAAALRATMGRAGTGIEKEPAS